MAFDVTALSNYVDESSKTLISASVLGADTMKFLETKGQVQYDIKGERALQLVNYDVVLQDGSDCGRTPNGNTTFSQRKITIAPIKDEQDYCPKALEKKWQGQYLTKGQTYNELLFAQEISEGRASKISEANEFLIWQGDIASGATNNLKRINGFLNILKTAGVTTSASTGTGVVAKLQAIYLAVPVAIRNSPEFVMFIGADVYGEYLVDLANKNIYKPTEDFTVFGTTAKFVVVNGLNTTRTVVCGKYTNFFGGQDLESEDSKASLTKSIETGKFYMDFHYALGVQVAYPSEVKLFTV